MSEDKYNKESNEYLFIQEQISSKRRSRKVRMLLSLLWTIILACVFALVAAVVFYLANPFIVKLLGDGTDKKTVEFPTLTPDDEGKATASGTPTPSVTPTPTPLESDKDDDKKETVYVTTHIQADIKDLASIYAEIKDIASGVNKSIVNIINVSSKVDELNENENYDVTRATTGLIIANNEVDILILATYDKLQDNLKLQLNNELSVKARLQDYDEDLNLAVVAVSLEDIPDAMKSNLEAAKLGESYSLTVGTPVIALGSPNGYVGSMELGIISSKDSSIYITDNKIDLFNTDINYNEKSDGVIVNMSGEVIGIITSKLKDEQNQNVNTVIGISKIKKSIQSMVNQTERSYFGIKSGDMSEKELKKENLEHAICVTEVEGNSPALEGGLQSGDMIIAINDVPISSVAVFNNTITSLKPKETVEVTIQRKIKEEPKEMKLSVVLGKVNNK
ncbi:PDZ domain-containing protein [Anaerocolumna sp. AGMB13020]|uniref:S1C family serine protease n=1 Tax=Anaerocolumna sp. AGMB13020 TaxID=3081750 RepID=UPI002954A69A|nr:PDZ domain-containing protein [Anaerocolumna sp. AGMB13020]WOO34798.1 PDZ domain-containing protein [Anaerocolumna sp. AGMB13020]